MRKNTVRTILGVLAAGAVALPGIAAAATQNDAAGHRGCEEKFDEAQRIDMESFRDFDAEAWREGHHEDAVSVFASGHRFSGIDAIMAAQKSHFENREAIWTWTEIDRHVYGCKTATIEYDATYELPSIGFKSRAITVVTYTFERGRWLSIYDQGTAFPPGQ
ncbi:DUF4440 domain-containing protein [Jiangella rhizosphaerae]|uniref:Nuclear transport factor 2 family protein n=1 Tax=Jiangella rhizosphaerae TaxID=2293569 RepID=A0A418KJ61_9ACTN|nr:DUF4440 domain-containing protein [Jiangella rhizosphaerae]RIQ13294.1 nuclear transport factor 2 family protein [Jiangella rhizosphaerae]